MKIYSLIYLSMLLVPVAIQSMDEGNDYAKEEREILYNPDLTVDKLYQNWGEQLERIQRWLCAKKDWEEGCIDHHTKKENSYRVEESKTALARINQKIVLIDQAFEFKKTTVIKK